MLSFLRRWSPWLTLLGILATGSGGLSACFLPTVWQRANALAREPQRLTLQELATKGPGDNPHVIVTDFACGNDYVSEIQVRKDAPTPAPDQAAYGKAWIPLFPKTPPENPDGEQPPTRFLVLLETSPTLASVQGFHMLSRRQSLEGLAMPLSQRGLQPQLRSRLAASYPDTDFENGLMLVQYEPREKEDASFFATALAVGAGGSLLVGLPALAFGIILGRTRRKQVRSSGAAGKKRPDGSKYRDSQIASDD